MVHYHSSEAEAHELCAEISRSGSRSWTICADLGEPRQAEELASRVTHTAGRIDFLINSASTFPPARLETLDLEGLTRSIRVNAWAPLVLSRSLARQSAQGRIVNLLDSALVEHTRDHAGYAMGKAVLAHLTGALALELAPRFTVNAVAPGLILPPPGQDQRFLEEKSRALPLRRTGSPQDIARAVVFLLESPFITGQTIFVDGGGHLR